MFTFTFTFNCPEHPDIFTLGKVSHDCWCMQHVLQMVSLSVHTLQVQQIQEAAATLIVAYSGEKAREIQHHEMEVVNAWRNLQLRVEGRRMQLSNSNDLYRFFSMARDLLNWMTDLSRQMESHEKPR